MFRESGGLVMSNERDRSWLVIVVAVLAVLLLGPMLMMGFGAFMGGMMGFGGFPGGMMGYGFGWWPFMFLVPLVFVVLVVLGIYYLLSGQRSQGASADHAENEALRILKERYARGGLTSEQYLKMRKDLEP
jgi:putative membrane protein